MPTEIEMSLLELEVLAFANTQRATYEQMYGRVLAALLSGSCDVLSMYSDVLESDKRELVTAVPHTEILCTVADHFARKGVRDADGFFAYATLRGKDRLERMKKHDNGG